MSLAIAVWGGGAWAQAPGAVVPPTRSSPAVADPVPAQAPVVAPSGGPKFDEQILWSKRATLVDARRSIARWSRFGTNRDFGDDAEGARGPSSACSSRAGSALCRSCCRRTGTRDGPVQGDRAAAGEDHRRGKPAVLRIQTYAPACAFARRRRPNSNAVSRELKLANENPAKSTTVVLRAGAEEGEVDAVVRVVEDRVTRWNAFLDNSGTTRPQHDRFVPLRCGHAGRESVGRDHLVAVQVTTSPEERDRSEAQPTSPDATSRLRLKGVQP